MVPNNSLDELELIATLIRDAWSMAEECRCNTCTTLLMNQTYRNASVFSKKQLRATINVVRGRFTGEGVGFLTKTLPRLGKCFDKALAGEEPLIATRDSWLPMQDQKIDPVSGIQVRSSIQFPRFLGELFGKVLRNDGTPLDEACIICVRSLRQILYLFYKYELPYEVELEQKCLDKFVKTDQDLEQTDITLRYLRDVIPSSSSVNMNNPEVRTCMLIIARRARVLLNRVLSGVDLTDIRPRHGPGVVSTKEQPWSKYVWTRVSERITDHYPYDAYFCASAGHVADTYKDWETNLCTAEAPAKVILVPKDSRGPRIISCEPVDNQWIQQGIMERLVQLIESHPLTKENVFFTNQEPNQSVALIGSRLGSDSEVGYATLDLNEASDRVSLELVRLLFPPEIVLKLECCRSSSTILPDGRVVSMRKFAPMGSALCFPIMALTIWSLLAAGAPDLHTKNRMLVYGDDVIVTTAYAERAMSILEAFGLKINRAKSCTKGFFRESCGVDAFKGFNVTPTKLRTVWTRHRSPESLESWVAYANQLFERKYYSTYDYIVQALTRLYGQLPDGSVNAPIFLCEVPVNCQRLLPRRWNKSLQRTEYKVLVSKSVSVIRDIPGWSKLLRWFTLCESRKNSTPRYAPLVGREIQRALDSEFSARQSVSQYTLRRTSMLVRRWR
jgi:hypothetical protein